MTSITGNADKVHTLADEERAVILLAHGSRDPLWRQPIEAVAERVYRSAPALHVRCAYLEKTTPDLPACAAELALLGVKSITVLPLFLGLGRHARDDIPVLMAQVHQNHPEILFFLKPAIGEEAQMIELMAQFALS